MYLSSTVNGGGGGNARSCLVSLYRNPTTVAGTSYNNLDVNYSTCQYSTAGTVATLGTKLKSWGVVNGNTKFYKIDDIILQPNVEYVLTCQTLVAGSSDLYISFEISSDI